MRPSLSLSVLVVLRLNSATALSAADPSFRNNPAALNSTTTIDAATNNDTVPFNATDPASNCQPAWLAINLRIVEKNFNKLLNPIPLRPGKCHTFWTQSLLYRGFKALQWEWVEKVHMAVPADDVEEIKKAAGGLRRAEHRRQCLGRCWLEVYKYKDCGVWEGSYDMGFWDEKRVERTEEPLWIAGDLTEPSEVGKLHKMKKHLSGYSVKYRCSHDMEEVPRMNSAKSIKEVPEKNPESPKDANM